MVPATIAALSDIPTPFVFGGIPGLPVKGPTYGRSLVGDANDTEELAGAPRAVPIGAGKNDLVEV
jgi:hypothetical protein